MTEGKPGPENGGAVLDEFQRIARFLRPLAREPGALALLDDAAILVPQPGQRLAITTDGMVAGVHFLPEDPAESVASKLLRVNYSDLAAMGATPVGYFLTVSLPRTVDAEWLRGFADGLAADQAVLGGSLLGGDSTSTPGPISVTMTAIGSLPADRELLRSTARPGELVCVSGTIGDGTFGLDSARAETRAAYGDNLVLPTDSQARRYLADRYRRPSPRLALGQILLDFGRCAIDVSDGLMADCGHIAETSGVCIDIRGRAVPLSDPVVGLVAEDPTLLIRAVTGGDDYEIVFTLAVDSLPAVTARAAEVGIPVTEIGRVRAPEAGETPRARLLDATGREIPIATAGWQHA